MVPEKRLAIFGYQLWAND